MQTRRSVYLSFALFVILCLTVGPAAAQEGGPVSGQGTLATAFTYQGLLNDGSGHPITATCDFQFGLYASDSGSTQVGITDTVTSSVVNGYFTASVNSGGEFGASAFDGTARWLDISVSCPAGTGSYTPLGPRQPLTPAPYAITAGHLAWGAVMTGTTGTGLSVSGGDVGVSGNGNSYGVYAQSNPSTGVGVFGSGTTGVFGSGNGGVYGSSNSAAGYGVEGIAWANSGTTYGVYGSSLSPSGYGGFFKNFSGGVGVFAQSYTGTIIEGDGAGDNPMFRVAQDGHVYANGGYTTGGADYAEMLPAVDGLQPGDLLAIGPDGKLMKTTSAYQASVAGVYSTEPGFVGGTADGQDTAGKIPLAVVGVVPVKACAENGAIKPGDLLTASNTPGFAMKAGANPPVGTLVGKALEPLADGTGVISVLVTLQ